MEAVTMKEYGQVITGLINRENLTKEESKEMFMEILGDRQTPMQQGAFLAALSAKGPTAAEVAGSFEAIYEIDTCKVTPQTAVPVVENCGTGMDTFKTFNISTVAGSIAAADGVPMAKHGSRALTSVSVSYTHLSIGSAFASRITILWQGHLKGGANPH